MTRTRVDPPPSTRLLLVSDELADLWFTRAADGRRLSVEWGKPDENGWYTPTITATEDDWYRGHGVAVERAQRHEEAWRALREAIAGLPAPLKTWRRSVLAMIDAARPADR